MKNSMFKAFALTLLISTTTHPMAGVEDENSQQQTQGTEQVNTTTTGETTTTATNTTNVDTTETTTEIPVEKTTEGEKPGFFSRTWTSIKNAPGSAVNGYKSWVSDSWSSKKADPNSKYASSGLYLDDKSAFENYVLGKGKVVAAHAAALATLGGLVYWLTQNAEEAPQIDVDGDIEQDQAAENPEDVAVTAAQAQHNLKVAMVSAIEKARAGVANLNVEGASKLFNDSLVVIASHKEGSVEYSRALIDATNEVTILG